MQKIFQEYVKVRGGEKSGSTSQTSIYAPLTTSINILDNIQQQPCLNDSFSQESNSEHSKGLLNQILNLQHL